MWHSPVIICNLCQELSDDDWQFHETPKQLRVQAFVKHWFAIPAWLDKPFPYNHGIEQKERSVCHHIHKILWYLWWLHKIWFGRGQALQSNYNQSLETGWTVAWDGCGVHCAAGYLLILWILWRLKMLMESYGVVLVDATDPVLD